MVLPRAIHIHEALIPHSVSLGSYIHLFIKGKEFENVVIFILMQTFILLVNWSVAIPQTGVTEKKSTFHFHQEV